LGSKKGREILEGGPRRVLEVYKKPKVLTWRLLFDRKRDGGDERKRKGCRKGW